LVTEGGKFLRKILVVLWSALASFSAISSFSFCPTLVLPFALGELLPFSFSTLDFAFSPPSPSSSELGVTPEYSQNDIYYISNSMVYLELEPEWTSSKFLFRPLPSGSSSVASPLSFRTFKNRRQRVTEKKLERFKLTNLLLLFLSSSVVAVVSTSPLALFLSPSFCSST